MATEKKLVVFDFDIPGLWNNKIFIAEQAAKVHHTILPSVMLFQKARERGIELVTQDIFFKLKDRPKKVLLISGLITPFTRELIAAGVKPILLTCQESPFIAARFYLSLPKISSWFKYSMVFSGMKKQLSPKTQYLQMFFPESFNPADSPQVPFAQKKFLTMVSSNKRLANWKKVIALKWTYGWKVKPIYSLRQEVVNFYSKASGFDLYGRDWEKGGGSRAETEAIKKVYRGPIADKTEVMKGYKFAFCFENAVMPGYVTEKIFDAMFAGCVPIYSGAPDITDLVPNDTFIDMRQFKNLVELDNFLRATDELQYKKYQENIKAYLASARFQNTFSQEHFAETIINLLEQEFGTYG